MRFLIFIFNAYSMIFVTSLVKEPEKLFSTYDFLNRYCTLKRFAALRHNICHKCSLAASREYFSSNFRKGKTQSDMFTGVLNF